MELWLPEISELVAPPEKNNGWGWKWRHI